MRTLERRAGSVQSVNTLLLIILVGVLLYFLARTQVDEPLSWAWQRIRAW
jgi:hypothetical protein